MTQVNTGISAEDRKRVAEGLSRVLADSYTLYVKTQNYHWNVEGPSFKQLHELFEEQYTDLREAIDEIAERIRALGHHAPGSFREFGKLAAVPEETGQPDWQQMVRQLAEDQETVVGTLRQVVTTAAQASDHVTEGLVTDRLQVHEKNAWMLRAHLS
ncbi:starvation-inducible DNA-binding protein [Limimonas halophila]|uniref:Starvation-inducible DNA-binding protein n=1 Tax=Limimonas halophila TaxID=1082479 RepID=A0A1G7TFX8_9PROT|nr:Dps family protein [Limimonas halophila]SDG34002.1 starvation-inducible DNA-binding protein [Limimonas halophila]